MKLATMTKYGLLIISVLVATIINVMIINYIKDYYPPKSYLSVFIDMMVTVFVFVPVLGIVSKLVKKYSKKYIATSKKLGKNRKRGFLIGFTFAFVLIFIAFAYVKHDMDVLESVPRLPFKIK